MDVLDELSPRGRTVYDDLLDSSELPEVKLLALQAARLSDRADELVRALGDDDRILRLVTGRSGQLELKVDAVFSEIRQTIAGLRQTTEALVRMRDVDEPEDNDDLLDDL